MRPSSPGSEIVEEVSSSLGHMPAGKWAFDEDVTKCFDDMLGRSIPQYEEMRRLCTSMAERFVRRSADVLDLGCSRGEALAPLVDVARDTVRKFFGVEVSAPMVQAARARFAAEEPGKVQILEVDLRDKFPPCVPSVVLSVLTLQFVPIEHRQQLVQRVHDALLPGGAFIVVEKVLGATAQLDEMLVTEYLAMKARNGYSAEEIQRKRMALEGVLVPVTARWNEELLRQAGFRQVDCFWRWCNFVGWVAVKDRWTGWVEP